LKLLIILDYVYRRTRGSPKLSNAVKALRYQWCKNNETNDFKNYLFSDETTVRVLEVPLRSLYSDVIQHFDQPFSRIIYEPNTLNMHQDNATTHYGKARTILEEIGVKWV